MNDAMVINAMRAALQNSGGEHPSKLISTLHDGTTAILETDAAGKATLRYERSAPKKTILPEASTNPTRGE